MREAFLLTSVFRFWVTLQVLWLGPILVETVRLGPEQADTQGYGMSAFFLLVMSFPAALGHFGTMAVVGRWRQRTGRVPLAAGWIPVVSGLLVAGFGYTRITRAVSDASEYLFGPSTEWIYLTLPLTLSVMATGIALALGAVARRNMSPERPVRT
jgi:TRAP-type C4-dicarboxylate transport system permease small subunit